MSDFLSNRFHEKKKIIMAIASVFILVFFAVYAGSCFVTCGKLFSKLFGQNYQLMMVVGALFVLLYTFLGGFLAESASDFMQAVVMIIAFPPRAASMPSLKMRARSPASLTFSSPPRRR